MKTTTLYGASDDLIELGGAIRDEFPADDDGNTVVFSDGTMARIDYTGSGLWKIAVLAEGSAEVSKIEATDPDSDQYSDTLTLTGDIEWAVVGKLAKPRS